MKILLANHDPDSRLLITRYLCAQGHQVVLADDGLQAWDVLQREDPPPLAILDCKMSGMSAHEVCRELHGRQHASKTYLLLLVPGEHSEPEQLFDLGADDYLLEPLGPGVLNARLRTAFRIMELQERCRVLEAASPLRERDPLTGIWSRSATFEFLRGQFARSTRDGISLAVILADIDNFEAIDTSFGSAASNSVIQEAVRRITLSLRPYDLLGRYSAEECLIVAPDCNMSNAFSLAERLRALISDKSFDIGDKTIHVTASFGIATTAETGALDEDGLLRSADAALYSAKERGRNRAEMAKRIPRQRSSRPRFAPQAKARELVQ